MTSESADGWALLIASLPGANSSLRMRLWRGLKACGAATLRDGVYLLPGFAPGVEVFDGLADELRAAGGSARLLRITALDDAEEQEFRLLFDRGDDYASTLADFQRLRVEFAELDEAAARRRAAALRRELTQVTTIDFFHGPAGVQAEAALGELEVALNRHFAPDEPHATAAAIQRRDPKDLHGRRWATRARLWVDRVASAWLIQRFIDPQAHFVWLANPAECPPDAVGFDFDGAEFSHAGARVTFETLLAAFGLETDPALGRIGAMVHYLDVGGVPVPEAAGFLAMLAGARSRCADDDDLLSQVALMLDHLYTAYCELPAHAGEY